MSEHEETDENGRLCLIAALNSTQATQWTLLFAQLFGEKKIYTDASQKVTVSKWRGEYYMIDYEPRPDAKEQAAP